MPKCWQLSKGRIKASIFHLLEENSNAAVLIILNRKDLFSCATFSKDKKRFGFVLFVPSNTRLLYTGSRQANTVLS